MMFTKILVRNAESVRIWLAVALGIYMVSSLYGEASPWGVSKRSSHKTEETPPQKFRSAVEEAAEEEAEGSEKRARSPRPRIKEKLTKDKYGNVTSYRTYHDVVIYVLPPLPQKAMLPCPKTVGKPSKSSSKGRGGTTGKMVQTRCPKCKGLGRCMRMYTPEEYGNAVEEKIEAFDVYHKKCGHAAIGAAYASCSKDELMEIFSRAELDNLLSAHPKFCEKCCGFCKISCSACSGTGMFTPERSRTSKTCSDCNGRGYVYGAAQKKGKRRSTSGSSYASSEHRVCESCEGKGRIIEKIEPITCYRCNETGLVKCTHCGGLGVETRMSYRTMTGTTSSNGRVVSSGNAEAHWLGDHVEGDLTGVILNLSRSADGSPRQRYNGKSLSDPGSILKSVVRDLVLNGFSKSAIADYYVAKRNAHLSYVCMPSFSSATARKTFDIADDSSSVFGWVGIYKGELCPKVSGKYRFVGSFDDCMVVRVKNKEVFEYYWGTRNAGQETPLKTGWEANAPTGQFSCRGLFGANLVFGDWFTLKAGQRIPIEIVIADAGGYGTNSGSCGGLLMIETQGESYDTAADGTPLFPLFCTRPLMEREKTQLESMRNKFAFSLDNIPVMNKGPDVDRDDSPGHSGERELR